MGTQVIPFAQAGELSYLKDIAFLEKLCDDIAGDVQVFASFPSISIKGKVFSIVTGDERKTLMKPDSPEETAQFLDGVMIRANDKARTYYSKGFTEGQEDQKPDCYSLDGAAPSVNAINRQNDRCPTCPHAVFGTRKNADGTMGKGTACSQNARVAFATPDALDKPYLLRVPPKSLKPMRDAIDLCRQRKLGFPVVVMRIGFNKDEASPVLTFRPVGLLPVDEAQKSVSMRDESLVKQICGLDERNAGTAAPAAAPVAPPPPADDPGADLDAALRERATQAAAAAPKPTSPAPAPAKPAPAVQEPIDFGALNAAVNGTVAASAVNPPATTQASQPQVVVSNGAESDVMAELNAMLGNIDKLGAPA